MTNRQHKIGNPASRLKQAGIRPAFGDSAARAFDEVAEHVSELDLPESVVDLLRLLIHFSSVDCVSIVSNADQTCTAMVGAPRLAEPGFNLSSRTTDSLIKKSIYSCLGRADYDNILARAGLKRVWSVSMDSYTAVAHRVGDSPIATPSDPFDSCIRLLARELALLLPAVEAHCGLSEEISRGDDANTVNERPIIDAISQMIWTANPGGKEDYFNRAWISYVVGKPDAGRPNSWVDAIHPEDLDGAVAHWERVLSAVVPFERECRLRRFDGTYRWHVVRAMPQCDPNRLLKQWIGTALDIDDTRSAEDAFRESEARLRSVVNGAPIILFALDAKGRFTLSDGSMLGSIGLKPGEVVGKSVFDLYRDHPLILHGVTRALRGESHTTVNAFNDRWFETMYMPQFDELHNVTGVVGVSVDVSSRQVAEAAVRSANEELEARVQRRTSELAAANSALQEQYRKQKSDQDNLELYANIVKNMQIGIYVYQLDNDGHHRKLKLVASNPAAAAFSGVPQNEAEGRFLEESDLPQHGKALTRQYLEVMQTSQPQFSEHVIFTSDGGVESAYSTRIFPLPNASIGAAFEDISERKQAEYELQNVLLKTEQMLGAISSIFIGLDGNGFVTTWNKTARAAFGQSASDVLGLQFNECDVRWDWTLVRQATEQCARTADPVHLENVFYTRVDGIDGYLDMHLNPISDLSGQYQGMLVLATDVTERLYLQRQLSQAQKLESIGQLAAGIAHEINTPIQYVGDNITFFKDAFETLQPLLGITHGVICADGPAAQQACLQKLAESYAAADVDYLLTEVPTAIGQSLDGVERVAGIVRAMKDFSHPGSSDKASVDLNKALESTLIVARSEWKYVAEVQTDFDFNMPLVSCYAADLNQVFLNIIVNAAHAIGDKVGDGSAGLGKIVIKTSSTPEWAIISFGDTGTGMTPDVMERIFDPFFTTKQVGKGTGQGLAISHSVVVDKHRGRIGVQSEVAIGSVFTIQLPISDLRANVNNSGNPQVQDEKA